MILVALGSNLVGRFETPRGALLAALAEMRKRGLKIVRQSRIFLTAPVPVSDQPMYHNAVVSLDSTLVPGELLALLQSIEIDMGRTRIEKNEARIIDLDLLAYKDVAMTQAALTLPHPRMTERAFVLRPLRDIAPDWIHPTLKKAIKDLPVPKQDAKPELEIMGIINVTPDSFSDGGKLLDASTAVAHGLELVTEGADILDIGGESTRPGSKAIFADEEQRRIMPVIIGLKGQVVSVDTRNPVTMRMAMKAGATMINDISALQGPEAVQTIAHSKVRVCLMHMQGTPETMQINPTYTNVIDEIRKFLTARVDACVMAGIDASRIIIDPGFGFGKSYQHNMSLLNNFDRFRDLAKELGVTVMAGVSRKRFITEMMAAQNVTHDGARLEGSLKAARILAAKGVQILRVHDVAETLTALTTPETTAKRFSYD